MPVKNYVKRDDGDQDTLDDALDAGVAEHHVDAECAEDNEHAHIEHAFLVEHGSRHEPCALGDELVQPMRWDGRADAQREQ